MSFFVVDKQLQDGLQLDVRLPVHCDRWLNDRTKFQLPAPFGSFEVQFAACFEQKDLALVHVYISPDEAMLKPFNLQTYVTIDDVGEQQVIELEEERNEMWEILHNYKGAVRLTKEMMAIWTKTGELTFRTTFRSDEIALHREQLRMASCVAKFEEDIKGCCNCDVELLVEGRSIKSSKYILMGHSTVFEAMLLSHFQDAKDGKVTIEKMIYEAMQELVNYMRFGIFEAKNFGLMLEVAMAAGRYNVQGLKEY